MNKTGEGCGTKIVAQYALLGSYDFLTIIQAEEDKDILKAAMDLGSRGTLQAVTIPAIPIDEFIKNIKG